MPPKPSKKAGSSILSFFRGASSTSESPRRPSTTEPGTQADPLVIDSDSDGDGNIRKEPPRKRRKPSSPKDRIYAKEELEEDGFELLVTDPKEEAGSGSDDDAAEALVDSECPVCGTSLSVMSSSVRAFLPSDLTVGIGPTCKFLPGSTTETDNFHLAPDNRTTIAIPGIGQEGWKARCERVLSSYEQPQGEGDVERCGQWRDARWSAVRTEEGAILQGWLWVDR